jgi:uncharacterized C2H2 Zn-finger protein
VNVEQERLESFLKTAELLQIKGLTYGLKDPGGGGPVKFSDTDPVTRTKQGPRSVHAKTGEEGVVQRRRKSVETAAAAVAGAATHLPPGYSSSPEKRLKMTVPPAAMAAAVQPKEQQPSSAGSEHSGDHGDMVIDDDYQDIQEEEEEQQRSDDDNMPPSHSLEDIKENYGDEEYVDDGEEPEEEDDGGDEEEYILLAGDAVTSAAGGGGMLTAGPGGEKEDLGPLHKRCPVCHMIMLKKNLSRHVRDQHTTERPRSVCPVCKKTYKTADWLKDHIRRGHGYSKDATDEVMALVKAQQEGRGGGNISSPELAAVSPPPAQSV